MYNFVNLELISHPLLSLSIKVFLNLFDEFAWCLHHPTSWTIFGFLSSVLYCWSLSFIVAVLRLMNGFSIACLFL